MIVVCSGSTCIYRLKIFSVIYEYCSVEEGTSRQFTLIPPKFAPYYSSTSLPLESYLRPVYLQWGLDATQGRVMQERTPNKRCQVLFFCHNGLENAIKQTFQFSPAGICLTKAKHGQNGVFWYDLVVGGILFQRNISIWVNLPNARQR